MVFGGLLVATCCPCLGFGFPCWKMGMNESYLCSRLNEFIHQSALVTLFLMISLTDWERFLEGRGPFKVLVPQRDAIFSRFEERGGGGEGEAGRSISKPRTLGKEFCSSFYMDNFKTQPTVALLKCSLLGLQSP